MFGIRSLMCVPLRSRGRIIGTVYLDSRREGSLFTKEDLRFIEAFADHAALAVENARERACAREREPPPARPGRGAIPLRQSGRTFARDAANLST